MFKFLKSMYDSCEQRAMKILKRRWGVNVQGRKGKMMGKEGCGPVEQIWVIKALDRDRGRKMSPWLTLHPGCYSNSGNT